MVKSTKLNIQMVVDGFTHRAQIISSTTNKILALNSLLGVAIKKNSDRLLKRPRSRSGERSFLDTFARTFDN